MARLTERRSAPLVLGVLSFVIILVACESVARLGWVNPFFTSQPTAIAKVLAEEVRSGELFHNLSVSLREFAFGFGAAIVVGLILGIMAGRYRTFEYILDPFIWLVY